MSPANAARRAAIGFQGGQVLSIRVSDEQLTSLRTTMREGRERWVEVEASDGAVLIDETPRTGIRGSQVAFLHPATAGGVLTELVTPVEVHP